MGRSREVGTCDSITTSQPHARRSRRRAIDESYRRTGAARSAAVKDDVSVAAGHHQRRRSAARRYSSISGNVHGPVHTPRSGCLSVFPSQVLMSSRGPRDGNGKREPLRRPPRLLCCDVLHCLPVAQPPPCGCSVRCQHLKKKFAVKNRGDSPKDLSLLFSDQFDFLNGCKIAKNGKVISFSHMSSG